MATIFEALAAVSAEVGAVRKQERNKIQNFNFRGIDTVVNAVHPALVKHGVVVVPELLEKELRESKTAKGSVMVNVYLTVRYSFFGPEGDSVHAVVAAESFDSGDKATAKAMSVALRTALLQTLMLPTDEIDSNHVSYERSVLPGVEDAEIESAGVDGLRKLWTRATPPQQARIRERVTELQAEVA